MDDSDLLIWTSSPFSLDICTLAIPCLRFMTIRPCFWIKFYLFILSLLTFLKMSHLLFYSRKSEKTVQISNLNAQTHLYCNVFISMDFNPPLILWDRICEGCCIKVVVSSPLFLFVLVSWVPFVFWFQSGEV